MKMEMKRGYFWMSRAHAVEDGVFRIVGGQNILGPRRASRWSAQSTECFSSSSRSCLRKCQVIERACTGVVNLVRLPLCLGKAVSHRLGDCTLISLNEHLQRS